jgi:hypothetical protein
MRVCTCTDTTICRACIADEDAIATAFATGDYLTWTGTEWAPPIWNGKEWVDPPMVIAWNGTEWVPIETIETP